MEHDSLLQQSTNFDRSVHLVKLSCLSSKDDGNKENMGMDKAEVPMLSVDPVSMKRKKKGGYNLRKSLVWDRAFLTEDGILDPVELSAISGTCINPGGRALSVITEVGSSFERGDSQNVVSSPSSQSHQRKKASQKMSTSHCATGSGAKISGCPRPSPTSSLKRPAFVNTSRSSIKELKFSKTAIPKPSMCSIPRSAKSFLSVGSQVQHTQFVHSVANNQTCPSSSMISTIKNTDQVKAGSAASPSTSSSILLKRSSAQATTTLPLHPSTKKCQPPVSKGSNTCLKKTPRQVDDLGRTRTKEDRSDIITPISQRTTAGKSMHHAQFQANKPSGLRMPSPSLGFFGQVTQPKVSVSNQPTLMRFKPSIPGLYNIHDHRKAKNLLDAKSNLSTMPLSSTTKSSALSDSDGVSCETSESLLEQNTKKFVHDEISNDELSMHRADKSDKVYAQHETGKHIVLKGDSECEASNSVLKQNMSKLKHAEISYNELTVHGGDSVSEHKINDTEFLPQLEDGNSTLEADDMEKSIQGFQDSRSNDVYSTCSASMCRVAPKGECEHKINDTGLVLQPEDKESLFQAGDMEKSIQGFQDIRSNDSYLTCSPMTEGEIISNSAVISPSLTCELALAAKDIVPDKKLSTENHHELPTESCYQSLDQSDISNYSAPEVPGWDKNYSAREVAEDNTCKCVEVLEISGEMKFQAPESRDSELEDSCFLYRGKYKDCLTDAGSRTEVDDETHLIEGQSHPSNGIHWANSPKNYLHAKAVDVDLKEYSEKHLEAERVHITVEESSHSNLEMVATGDLLLNREPRHEKVIDVPSSTAPDESDKQCESTTCTKRFSLPGQMEREKSRSSQHNLDGLKNNHLEDKDNAEILYKVDTSAPEDSDRISGSISIEKIKNPEKDMNKNDLQIILPKDLVPFSEEWLAVFEAAGEDVLTLKTGAVQNSPPDKSLPDPSPWSPVKRKTNQLGPFDCTKYTNQVPSDSPH